MDGKQFDGGDAKLLQMFDHRPGREPGIGASQVVGDVRVPRGKASHMHFINDGLDPMPSATVGRLPR